MYYYNVKVYNDDVPLFGIIYESNKNGIVLVCKKEKIE